MIDQKCEYLNLAPLEKLPRGMSLCKTVQNHALHKAVRSCDSLMVKLLLDQKINCNKKNTTDNLTPLQYALKMQGVIQGYRFENIAEMLIKHGANCNVKDHKGLTPLHYAVNKLSIDLVQLLLNHGANGNVKDHNGLTPLHYAVKVSRTDLVKLLLSHGANGNVKDHNGLTPLHYAVYGYDTDIVQLLLNHGANCKAKIIMD